MRSFIKILLAMILSVAGTALAYDGPVIVDDANLLDGEQLVQIENAIEKLNSEGNYLLVLLTVPSIEGQNIDSYAKAVMQVWGIKSSEGGDNGVLMLLVRDTKTVYFMIGEDADFDHDFTAYLTTEILQPAFESENYFEALQDAFKVLREGIPGESKTYLFWIIPLLFFVLVFIFANTLNRRKRKCPHCGAAIPPIVSRCPKCLGDLRHWAVGESTLQTEPDVILDSSDLHRLQSLRWLDLRFLMWQSTSFGGFTAGGPGELPEKKSDRGPFEGPVMTGGF